ncbi:MAG TPA: hypothetical protein VNA27_09120 [Rubrobacteraceae bacterium]|nr:hypothetical protein [Rubrobacteraceae bacterium]
MQVNISYERSFVPECVCGENLVVLGREKEWHSRNPIFECECGEHLTLPAKNVGQEKFLDAG